MNKDFDFENFKSEIKYQGRRKLDNAKDKLFSDPSALNEVYKAKVGLAISLRDRVS